MEDNENKIFEENTYWPQTLGDEAVGKKLDILHTSSPTETASVIAEKEKKIYDRPAEAFKILPEDLSEIYVGTETQLELVPIVDEGDAAPNSPTVVWESSDLSVAFVGDGNILGALSEGSATITATDINNPGVRPVSKEVVVKVYGTSSIYTITYDANGGELGEIVAVVEAGENGEFTIPSITPTKEGNNFLGWALDSTSAIADYEAGSDQVATDNITLYAIWQAKPRYTVIYDANGGQLGEVPSNVLTGYDGLFFVNSNSPVKEDHEFLGWALSSEAEAATIQPESEYTISADTTLYAVWYYDENLHEYLTFTALDDNSSVSFVDMMGQTVQYSLDKITWTDSLPYDTVGGSDAAVTTIDLNSGESVYFRGTNNSYFSADYVEHMQGDVPRSHFEFLGEVSVSGNIMSLIYGDEFDDKTTLTSSNNYAFAGLFCSEDGPMAAFAEGAPNDVVSLFDNYNYSYTTSDGLVDASNLKLPATTLSDNCYECMFAFSGDLEHGPAELPASTLKNVCYSAMFMGCSSLLDIPEICQNLTIPTQQGLNNGSGSMDIMFAGCTSLERINIANLNLSSSTGECVGIFMNCTSLVEASVPFTADYMFADCSSLRKITCLNSVIYGGGWIKGTPDYGEYVLGIDSTWGGASSKDEDSNIKILWKMYRYNPETGELLGPRELNINKYFTVTVIDSLGTDVSLPVQNLIGEDESVQATMNPAEYSLDGGATWSSEAPTGLSAGAEVCIKANNDTYFLGVGASGMIGGGNVSVLKTNGHGLPSKYCVSGNIMSLIYGDEFVGKTVMPGSFYNLFANAGDGIVSALNLVLPATTFTGPGAAYQEMFYECSYLKLAPEFPEEAENEMLDTFKGCSALINYEVPSAGD